MSDDDFDPIRAIRRRLREAQACGAPTVTATSLLEPAVRELLAHAPADIALLLDLVDHFEDELDALHAEVERLTPPETEPHPSVERAMARFRAKLAELQVARPQEDDGEPE